MLTSLIDPSGNMAFTLSYDSVFRVNSRTDALGTTTHYMH